MNKDNLKALIGIIAAISKNGYIGMNGELPWQAVGKWLKGDLPRFKTTTVGNGNNAVIVGRTTLESFGNKAFPDRKTCVLSRDPNYSPPEGVTRYFSLEEALEALKNSVDEIWICGGAQVYTKAFKYAHKMILTETFDEYEGDVLFPPYDPVKWLEENRATFLENGYRVRELRHLFK